MRKLIIIPILAILGVISCSSCKRQDNTVKVVDPPTTTVMTDAGNSNQPEASAPKEMVISQDNWSLTLPNSEYIHQQKGDVHLYVSDDNGLMIQSQKWDGTLPQFTLLAIRALKETGRQVSDDLNIDHFNGKDWMRVDAKDEDQQFYFWNTVSGKNVFAIGCVGMVNDPALFTVCNKIAHSIQIK